MKRFGLWLLSISLSAYLHAEILKELPGKIDVEAHYLFYLHGRIIEEQGIRPHHPQFGFYEYEQIVKALEDRGFIVISEPRPEGTEPDAYAGNVVQFIRELLRAGVPPGHISVIGASKGGVIAMLASTRLKNPKVKFVIMANCNDYIAANYQISLTGEVLSIFEESDEIGHSCRRIFSESPELEKSDEIELRTGHGHGFLYRPLPDWIDPAVSWILPPDE